MHKKTKIVCTIGPASDSVETLQELMKAGMNVCRLNMSHGTREEQQARIDNINRARMAVDDSIAIMLDTKGPEIRIRDFENGKIDLAYGDKFIITTRDVLGDESIVSVSYQGLPQDVKPGDMILIDDGLVELEVETIEGGTDIHCIARNYGSLSNRKGVNLPHSNVQLPPLTDNDIEDLKFGIKNNIDVVAASFIRKASDVLEIRRVLEENGGDDIWIISKIESQEGVDNMDEIIEASDGVMVARGDLGVEIESRLMPMVQKEMIKKCNQAAKPVITATQMLDSMTRNPRPTRAEVTDVANAILDGSDAVMLSGETAAGKYPVESVRTMSSICVTTENSEEFRRIMDLRDDWIENSTVNSISKSTVGIARQLSAKAILSATSSGATARQVSKFRPSISIIAATFDEKVKRKMSMVWGIRPIMAEEYNNTDKVIDSSIMSALDAGYIDEGDLIVITAGIPVSVAGSTNLIQVHTVGSILAKGLGIGKFGVAGKICTGVTPDDFEGKFEKGDVLVAPMTSKELMPFVQEATGIIVEEGGLTSHAAIVALNLGIPAIVGVDNVMDLLEDGVTVTVDPMTGIVYKGKAKVL